MSHMYRVLDERRLADLAQDPAEHARTVSRADIARIVSHDDCTPSQAAEAASHDPVCDSGWSFCTELCTAILLIALCWLVALGLADALPTVAEAIAAFQGLTK
jgi:hypothetical protein